MLRLPGAVGQLCIHRERMLSFRLCVTVLKIVNHFFHAHSTCWRQSSLVEESAHIAIRRSVHIKRERRERILCYGFEAVFINVIISFRVTGLRNLLVSCGIGRDTAYTNLYTGRFAVERLALNRSNRTDKFFFGLRCISGDHYFI